jgi:hypothetical protein
MKETKDLFHENYKILKREIEEDIRRWKDLPCSWAGRINIVKMIVLPKAIFMFSAIPIKIPRTFCREIEKSILKYIWKHKRPRIAKAILSKSPMLEASQYLTSNYTRVITIKTAWHWHENRQEDQWIRIKDPDINPRIYDQLIFDKHMIEKGQSLKQMLLGKLNIHR